jgi:hypothetical protein
MASKNAIKPSKAQRKRAMTQKTHSALFTSDDTCSDDDGDQEEDRDQQRKDTRDDARNSGWNFVREALDFFRDASGVAAVVDGSQRVFPDSGVAEDVERTRDEEKEEEHVESNSGVLRGLSCSAKRAAATTSEESADCLNRSSRTAAPFVIHRRGRPSGSSGGETRHAENQKSEDMNARHWKVERGTNLLVAQEIADGNRRDEEPLKNSKDETPTGISRCKWNSVKSRTVTSVVQSASAVDDKREERAEESEKEQDDAQESREIGTRRVGGIWAIIVVVVRISCSGLRRRSWRRSRGRSGTNSGRILSVGFRFFIELHGSAYGGDDTETSERKKLQDTEALNCTETSSFCAESSGICTSACFEQTHSDKRIGEGRTRTSPTGNRDCYSDDGTDDDEDDCSENSTIKISGSRILPEVRTLEADNSGTSENKNEQKESKGDEKSTRSCSCGHVVSGFYSQKRTIQRKNEED